MSNFFDKILLKDTLELKGTASQIKSLINSDKSRGFRVVWISENEFKFVSKFSLGTASISYGTVEGIKGFASVKNIENKKVKIILTTKIRVEIYFLAILNLLFTIFILFTKEHIPFWINFLIPFALIWFWFVYRVQEKILFKKVKKYFNNLNTPSL